MKRENFRGRRELQQFDIDDEVDGKTTPPTPTILLSATPVPTINSDNAPSASSETEAPTPPWYVRTTSAPSPNPASPSAAPTDTDEFPVELRTTPPTPTALFPRPSDEPTHWPMHEYPTFYPTMEPTCANTSSRAGHIKCAAMYQISQVQADWSTIDTIILSVSLTMVFFTCFLYCLCCRQGKDVIDVDTSRVGKGHYSAVDNHDLLLTPETSPPTTPRRGRYGGVEVINPLAETSPLLSPPRERERDRRTARREVAYPPIPVRQPAKSLRDGPGVGGSGAGDAGVGLEGAVGGGVAVAEAEAVRPPAPFDDDDITSLL